jgi:hypothetical protein
MSVGAYGQTIPMYIPTTEIPDLVDISFTYHENRTYDSLTNTTFKKLSTSVLTPAVREQSEGEVDQFIEGMYNLRLPLSEFNKKGFYTVYIKPKEIEAVIADVSSLTAYPNVRGIVLDITQIKNSNIQEKARTNNELVGYRVIFLDEKGVRQPFYRIITSINKCEPVVKAPTSSSDKSYTYRYEDSSSLVFATLSPSSAPSFKGNSLPYIGKPTQKILLVNTFFEPIQIDIEMTTHDADTISNMLEGSQLRDIDNGLITTFNEKNEIYHQSEHYTLKDQYSGEPVYEVKENRNNNIDFSQTIEQNR